MSSSQEEKHNVDSSILREAIQIILYTDIRIDEPIRLKGTFTKAIAKLLWPSFWHKRSVLHLVTIQEVD